MPVRDSEGLALAHDVTLGIGEDEDRDALTAALSVMVLHMDGVGGMMGVMVPESVGVELVERVPTGVTMVAPGVALGTALDDADTRLEADGLCVGLSVEIPDADTVPEFEDTIVPDAQPVGCGDDVGTGDEKIERNPEFVVDAQTDKLGVGCAERVTVKMAVCESDTARDKDAVAHKDATPDAVAEGDRMAGAVGVEKMVADAAVDKVAIADADVVEKSDAVILNVVSVKFVIVAGGDGDATRVASVLLVKDRAGDGDAVTAPDGRPDELGRNDAESDESGDNDGVGVAIKELAELSVGDSDSKEDTVSVPTPPPAVGVTRCVPKIEFTGVTDRILEGDDDGVCKMVTT